MSIYKPSLLDKFKDFVNGLKGNWEQYEAHVADFEAHLAENVTDAHGLQYEVGDWTPRLTINNGNAGIVQTNFGKYVRVGNLVHVNGGVVLAAKGTNVGVVRVAGLPFITSVNPHGQGMGIGDIRNATLDTGFTGFHLYLISASDFFEIGQHKSGGHSDVLRNTNIADNFVLLFSFDYMTT